MNRIAVLCCLIGLIACGATPTESGARPSLSVVVPGPTDLGTLPGSTFSDAAAVNNMGLAVGVSLGPTGFAHAALWDTSGGAQDLGTIAGFDYSQAWGLNDLGQIVGTSGVLPFGAQHAALWTVGAGVTVTDLGGTNSQAFDINDAGRAVGVSDFGGQAHAALWTVRGTTVALRDLGTLPGGSFSAASAINRRGQIAGLGSVKTGETHAVLWSLNEAGASIRDLGALLKGGSSGAVSLNDRGQVVGYWDTPTLSVHVILWTLTPTGVTVRDLGTPPEWVVAAAYGISNRGEIIGSGSVILGGRQEGHAFLWTPRDGFTQLPDLGFGCSPDPFIADCSFAEGMNDLGSIAGRSWAGADNHAALWTVGH
jgi:uncharacterized membrane protein